MTDKNKQLKLNIITLFPDVFVSLFSHLPYKRAIEVELLKINIIDLKNFAIDKRGTVDDKPYGGGVGMLLRIEPLYNALKSINMHENLNLKTDKVILLSPKGKRFKQEDAKTLLEYENITFICGRYEGYDERINDFVTDVYSLGDFVLSGGEIPAMAMSETIVRLIPGAIKNEEAVIDESFSSEYLEYPQYTRPEEFLGKKVPEVLISGDHKKIKSWKKNNLLSLKNA